jgi:leucyl aminopeptidase
MDIIVKDVKRAKIAADAVIIFGTEKKPVLFDLSFDEAVKLSADKVVAKKIFAGKKDQHKIIDCYGAESCNMLALCGLGTPDNYSALRKNAGHLVRCLRSKGAEKIAVVLPDMKNAALFAQTLAEGLILGAYTFTKYQTVDVSKKEIKTVSFFAKHAEIAEIKDAITKAEVITRSVMIARDMVNEPGNEFVPADMVAVAKDMAKESKKLSCKVYDVAAMEKMGMGGILAVGKGSINEPKLIVLSYKGRTEDKVDLALVGKGVTFDTGGISLKSDNHMDEMKGDMAGAASVLAAVQAVAALGLKVNVTAVVGAVENMPGGKAYKPGDIIKSYNGKTIEVISADAEGRVTLADTVSFAYRGIKADRIIDVATLTGACVVALGHVCSASYTNNQKFMDLYKKASDAVDEKTWQMPMFEEYRELNKSKVADVMNIGGGRDAGSITAAYFIYEFTDKNPWIHLDIAGVEMVNKTEGFNVYGGTGTPVRTFVALSELLANELNKG